VSDAPRVRKIAILGGGCGAIAAAFALTEYPGWKDRFEVTVYQLGWRLGGKGASGRCVDPGLGSRIEEHGLHLWAGFYHNAFLMMRKCYAELGRPGTEPLPGWDQAFLPMDTFCSAELVLGVWKPWRARLPRRSGSPGDSAPNAADVPSEPAPVPNSWEMMLDALAWLEQELDARRNGRGLCRLLRVLLKGEDRLATELTLLLLQMRKLSPDAQLHSDAEHDAFAHALKGVRGQVRAEYAQLTDLSDEIRHFRIIADLILTCSIGMLVDDVPRRGFDSIDGKELCAWLDCHGATREAMASAIVSGGYDYVFGFRLGDPKRPEQAAGVALRGFMRLLFGYKGSIFWKMQVGMGDAVFAPLYCVLKRRGVQFKFFHRVDGLDLSSDGKRIERIRMTRQVQTKCGDYDPLIEVRKLPAWPSKPRFALLKRGDELERGWPAYDLESAQSKWPYGCELEPLVAGKDFHEVVLGISLGAFKDICSDLVARVPGWREMAEGVGTVRTMACQLWLKAGSRWTPPALVMTNYEQRLNTIADMSHLIPWEDWPAARAPEAVYYFCGPMGESDKPGEAQAKVKEYARGWMTGYAPWLLRRFAFKRLFNPTGANDPFDAQYFRANVSPSERYVLHLPGTTELRMRAGESGVDHLFLAGDWVRTGLNAGCVEAAVMGGIQAARAIAGDARPVPGERDT
jgi:uncharacterized protein with NAD-binding domain and iron-sulfur cluster